jgi:hypothetical protein
MRFRLLEQPFGRRQSRQCSPTAFEAWHDADEAFRQPAFSTNERFNSHP